MLKENLQRLLRPPVVDFNEGKHTYTNKENGDLYTGCTTISGNMEKSFLGPWYAKEAIDFLRPKQKELANMEDEEFQGTLDMAKKQAPLKADEAKEAGTIAHDWIEQYIDGKKGELPDNKQSVSSIKAFLKWEKEAKPEWLASEIVVDSVKHKIGGKIDAVASIGGIPCLVDFKTSNQISESYFTQLGGYSVMLEEMGFTPRVWMVLRLPKDGKDAETLTVDSLTEQGFYKEIFLHQREMHRFLVYIENNKKQNNKIKTD
jgi:hypothetical protein